MVGSGRVARSVESGHHVGMARPTTRLTRDPGRPLAAAIAIVLAALVALVAAGWTGGAAAAEPSLSRWRGGIDLYRSGVFTTQRSWLWCTAADVQIARNIVDHERDHSTDGQRTYFEWMRRHNRYDLPLSAGVDAAGWAAGMRHFVDGRYRLVASSTFDNAVHLAVQRMRMTNLPVAVTVSHGNHGWLLVGFQATADPAKTDRFTVTSVRVIGPLFGLQSRGGYDMPPNTRLTLAQFRRFFTPWHYDPKPMVWDGTYVSIQPVPSKAAASRVVAPRAVATKRPASPKPAVARLAPPTPAPAATAFGIPQSMLGATPLEEASVDAAVATGRPTPASNATPAAPGVAGTAALESIGPVLIVLLVAASVGFAVVSHRAARRDDRPG
jgi:hypothetical protein